jgi:formate/nitrite transporter FocA (FNT family)
MSGGALPRDVWDRSFEEGERRIKRRIPGQASTGLLGGFDVMLGLAVVFSLTGALMTVTGEELAHAIGALPFGLAFVFLTIGRSELFTENFLVPVGAFLAGRGTARELLSMWAITLTFNLVGIATLAALLSIDGVLPAGALDAAGVLGDTFIDRGSGEAFASAIIAGIAITLFTWVTLAATSESTRVVAAMLIGYVLLLPVLNHAVVSFGEVMLAVFGGTTDADLGEVAAGVGIAVAGNTIGGIGFVTLTRLVQVAGEPHDPDHARSQTAKEGGDGSRR